MISFFRSKKKQANPNQDLPPLLADMHSHLLPGLDDGAETVEQSLALLRHFEALGYQKLIMTPHVMGDYYRNTPEGIGEKLQFLRDHATQAGIQLDLEAAAEYYLDESFIERLEKQEDLLCFGGQKRYVLFETSYMNAFPQLEKVIFDLQTLGYTPVLAHPERYVYWFDRPKDILKLPERGVLLQVNINSLTGYYSKPSKKIAEMLIDEGVVRFLGSDCHGERHIEVLKKARTLPTFQKALSLDLLNQTLIDS
ncbi:MAG: tyrosine-protein phosphatase [Bernardetiaceae bacterium]